MKIGDRVKVKATSFGRTSRIDTIRNITVNSQGTTLYWLCKGGCFSISEIERY